MSFVGTFASIGDFRDKPAVFLQVADVLFRLRTTNLVQHDDLRMCCAHESAEIIPVSALGRQLLLSALTPAGLAFKDGERRVQSNIASSEKLFFVVFDQRGRSSLRGKLDALFSYFLFKCERRLPGGTAFADSAIGFAAILEFVMIICRSSFSDAHPDPPDDVAKISSK